MTNPAQMLDLNKLIQQGPITYVLVYSVTCPHCHTYKPIWSELCAMKGKRANLVSMEASTYDKTPMSEKRAVSGVPTVLYVDQKGQISEVSEPRNREVMTNAVKLGVAEPVAAANVVEPAIPVSKAPAPATESPAVSSNMFRATTSNIPVAMPIPGTQVKESELPALPAGYIQGGGYTQTGGGYTQTGGNPWSAFISVARQAAPAALLVGAYAAARSSGLGRSTRRHRSGRSRSLRRRR